MSTKQTTRCDACQDYILSSADHFTITMQGKLNFILPESSDLCRSCYEQAREMFQEWAKSKRPTIKI